ncbi:MAG: Na+/H+ antiporter NhaC [Andreesenia angusta]|nr:Na+/H+ antiporter NhaC [Andreesenia angusta]
MEDNINNHQEATFGISLLAIASIVFIMFMGVMYLKTISIQTCLIVSITLLCIISSYFLKYSFNELMDIMAKSIKNGAFGLWFFIAIGGIISSYMMSGTVPAIIYYGVKLINPKIFLPACLLLSSITAISTGTSWGTVGTIGVALIGIGQGMGIPLPIIAAAIVSGATFGDKMSPISDTPNLASMASGSELIPTIKAMMTTITPAFIISFFIFAILGLKYSDTDIDYRIIEETKTVLENNFNLNPIVLLPIFILLILTIKKFPSLPGMAIAISLGIAISIIFQNESFTKCIEALNSGFNIETGSDYVDPILNRGGLQNMLGTFSIAFLGISMGGLLNECGYLKAIFTRLLRKIKGIESLSIVVMISSIMSTALLSEAYLSYILNGAIYKKEFDRRGVSRVILARLISEGGLMPAPLMPWTTFGAFCIATLGISGIEFAPYAFLNYLSPIISLLMTYMGIGIVWNKNKEREYRNDQ